MVKEEFYKLLKKQGFTSLRQFARATEISVGNIYSNISGRYKLSIERAFIFAKVAGVPVDTILNIFYADDMAEINKILSEKS